VKTSRDYIDEVLNMYNLTQDQQAADKLGLSPAAVSHYRTGRRAFSDEAAFAVAEALGINAAEVIAAANAEREKDEEKRKKWERWFRTVAATVATIALTLPQVIDSSLLTASHCILCKMKWRRMPATA